MDRKMGRSPSAVCWWVGLVVFCAGCPSPETRSPGQPTPADNTAEHATQWMRTLDREAAVAAEHIGYAMRKSDDLKWMQRHLHHMRHALDPSTEQDGPGLGAGVIAAAVNIEASMRRASRRVSPQGVRKPTTHQPVYQSLNQIRATSENILGWANGALILSDNALAEPKNTTEVAMWVSAINELIKVIRYGVDANGDGTVSASTHEGGIAQGRATLERLHKLRPR